MVNGSCFGKRPVGPSAWLRVTFGFRLRVKGSSQSEAAEPSALTVTLLIIYLLDLSLTCLPAPLSLLTGSFQAYSRVRQ